ncbi:MAG: gamma-glutamyltransferase family protein [Armatimonadetes bacterium]|nr:gamma-glutamyltransferase family protein [Armatimonadota bacterium]
MSTHAVISTGHYLATSAGLRILHQGGNAIDAGIAAGFCLAVLEPQLNGIGGEVPILIYSAERGKVFAINGQGTAPKRATIEWFRKQGISLIPGDGFLPATVPAAFDAWVTALREFGTMTLAEVLVPAVEIAEFGFPMYAHLRNALCTHAEKFLSEWPTSAEAFLPDGKVPEIGEIYRQPYWAATFRKIIQVEKEASNRGRDGALEAARDAFYKGEIAERIAEFAQSTKVKDATGVSHSGLIEYDDLAGYRSRIEDPVSVNYRGYDVFKCGPWSQGPVFLQQLNLLEGFDLRKMGHNSADYIHTIIECAKLAFADREAYYGDPEFDDVPLDILLSKDYADSRRALIDQRQASDEFRPGDVGRGPLPYDPASVASPNESDSADHDTTHLDVVDAAGNMFSATPSGGWLMSSPAIPGLGFPLGTRGQMFFLDSRRPNALQPGKRPRTTLTPSLCIKDGMPFMAFGTPGGDMQDQWTLQFFLNVVDFGMNVQEAVDAPLFHTSHFPSSFYPRTMLSKRLAVEERIPESIREELARRGHIIAVGGPWAFGRVLGIQKRNDVIFGSASPRMETAYAAGW